MPTNDERRDVARRLRSISGSHVTKGEYEKAIMLKDGCDELERLADLIEPEPERTCNRITIYSMDFRESYKGCSECHNPLNVLDAYCSRCGAKVV